jgi:carbon storage regulator
MLVLTRRVGESLRIGNDIQVKIIGMRGDLVRIGIRAPKTIPVKDRPPSKRRQA